MDDKKYILNVDELVAWKNEIQGIKKIKSEESFVITEFDNNLPKIKSRERAANKNKLLSSSFKFGDLSRMNSTMQKSISKGKYQIDAKIDLHRYSRDKAYIILMDFLNASYKKKYRMLLIITGKGLNSSDQSFTIKESFFRWIKTWEMENNLLYVNYAHKKHGGKGAFYLLLERQL